jgi:predicted transcriptional regulator
MSIPEDLDQEKLAEVALAILSLSRMVEPYGVTAWKGIDWDVMNMLHDKGWISNPVGKQKSVGITEEGIKLADQFLEKHFAK